MSEQTGRVAAVTIEALGDELLADAAAGATSLLLDDAADFNEDGGSLLIAGQVIQYADVDDETGLVTFAAGQTLTASALAGDRVDIWDVAASGVPIEVVAHVVVEGDELADDTLEAIVEHSLIPYLPEGIRGDEGEAVALEWRGSDLVVTTILGKAPLIDVEGALSALDGNGTGVRLYREATGGQIDFVYTEAVAGTLKASGDAWTELSSPGLVSVRGEGGSGTAKLSLGDTGTYETRLGGDSIWLDAQSIAAPGGLAGLIRIRGSHGVNIQTDSSVGEVALSTAAGQVIVAEVDGTPKFPAHGTSSNAANVWMSSQGRLYRSTSSERYKTDVEPLPLPPTAILAAEPVQFRDKATVERGETADAIPGFIAEQLVDAGLDLFVTYDEDGQIEAVSYDRLVAAVIPLLQDHESRLSALEARLPLGNTP